MLKASRSRRKKKPEMITALVIRSLVYFTCMKKSTTRMALKVAMVRARMVFNRPKSRKAAETVRPVQTNSVIQMVT